MKRLIFFAAAAMILAACGYQIPQEYTESDELPQIYPDYTDVTVPVNIAPLTFELDDKADDVVARLSAGDEEVVCGGPKIQPTMSDWQRLVQAALGQQPSAIQVEVFVDAL